MDDAAVDESERARQIRRVLSYYDENFTKYLATTISLTECLPEEINNQIRNAFTHLARAQDVSDVREFNSEIEKAISHIDRGNRDCLKASIIIARDQLDRLVTDAMFYHGALTPEINTRRKLITRMRRETYRAETQGKKDIVPRLETMLRHVLHTSNLIKEQYQEAGTRRIALIRWAFRWSRPVMTFGALLIGYLARPFTEPLVQFLKEYLGRLLR